MASLMVPEKAQDCRGDELRFVIAGECVSDVVGERVVVCGGVGTVVGVVSKSNGVVSVLCRVAPQNVAFAHKVVGDLTVKHNGKVLPVVVRRVEVLSNQRLVAVVDAVPSSGTDAGADDPVDGV